MKKLKHENHALIDLLIELFEKINEIDNTNLTNSLLYDFSTHIVAILEKYKNRKETDENKDSISSFPQLAPYIEIGEKEKAILDEYLYKIDEEYGHTSL